jgi:hypothetical protein
MQKSLNLLQIIILHKVNYFQDNSQLLLNYSLNLNTDLLIIISILLVNSSSELPLCIVTGEETITHALYFKIFSTFVSLFAYSFIISLTLLFGTYNEFPI